ncbi:hypothetical protein A3A39_02545 [Candidatus Kaiserbacteria bacterium RIFCSPLOWO2_01_FULL_54_13]|uniref:Diacylglycerol kinase n=1 Tax=Candidatus Kaiserbacteria bacterium RIFCSPLOWO2_01_FULL_54_13 TaxID=1798512 RepID=A0A1F6F3G8_9BACT|nr:MAG: hypothetical protein A3A39_02545 [Candidatus Kaiserbacteria bacterium RIFCSPLOWO2_01_FULL_54_13]
MSEKKLHNVRYALNGVKIAWQEEFSFRIEILATLLVLLLGWFFEISRTEWLFVVFMISLVLSAEVFNTALEELCDKFKSDPDPHIAKIKDLAAAAVLIAAIAAFVIGATIFVPYFRALL